jgi:hypothetical protein
VFPKIVDANTKELKKTETPSNIGIKSVRPPLCKW